MKTQFCDNCEAHATCYYTTEKGTRFHLCHTCREAFELGQVNPNATIEER